MQTLLQGLEPCCIEGATWTYNRDERKTPTQSGYSSKIVVDENYILRISENIPMDRAAALLPLLNKKQDALFHIDASDRWPCIRSTGSCFFDSVDCEMLLPFELDCPSKPANVEDFVSNLNSRGVCYLYLFILLNCFERS
ncbi:MAG: hypothetical protein DLM72_02850 [Candidatus Nitrosopolaris wilkensis]|nr:MAG: hypothetical protein DLM72_02850 [Candidatus Nitrosopolaris wilkensis]